MQILTRTLQLMVKHAGLFGGKPQTKSGGDLVLLGRR
jgi:hypothetical protein